MKKNIKNNPFYMVIMLFMIVGFAVSCSNDDSDTSDNTVELLSFGPSGQKHGEMISFIGHNLDRVTSIKLEGVEVSSSDFSSQTSEKIELIIPDEALEGKVVLVYDGGEVTSKTVLSFDVPFMITSITPEAKPGENITITGEYLNWVESIVFANGIEVTEFVSSSINTLVVKVPLEAQTGQLSILGGGTDPYTYQTESDIKIDLPNATSIEPQSVKHGGLLTINGEDLDLVKSIKFPNSTESIAFESQTVSKIVVKVPLTATDGKIMLTAYSGVVVEVEQPVKIILPIITSALPKPVAIGKDWTLTGTDLDLVKEVIIPGASSPITSFGTHTATKIVLTVPDGAFNGVIKLKTINDFLIETTTQIEIAGLTDIPLKRVIYDDDYKNGFGNWSWGGDVNPSYTVEVREGTKAIRKDWQDWDGLRFGGGSVSTAGMTELAFSVYGGVGLENNQQLGLMINGNWGITTVQVKIGEWTDVVIPLSSLPALSSATDINDFAIQGKFGYVIVDKVGLR
nr:IPT/TIG domain-containing protein [uncultured Flavobacterium sp.]